MTALCQGKPLEGRGTGIGSAAFLHVRGLFQAADEVHTTK